MRVEPGMLERTFLAVGNSHDRWVASFCAAVLPLKGRDYERFVRLVREETVGVERDSKGRDLAMKESLQRYTNNETRPRAFQCLEHAGQTASPVTQFDLYLIAQSLGQRPPTNPFSWLRKAADGSQPMAQYLMAEGILNQAHNDRLREVIPVGEHDRIQLFHSYLRSAARNGVPQAQYLLGTLYLGGTKWGTAFVNVPQGIELLKRAASQSQNPDSRDWAASKLGEAYFSGKLVPQDYREAFRWYSVVPWERTERCTGFGHVRHQLGLMYRDGLGVARDPEKAEQYLRGSPAACP